MAIIIQRSLDPGWLSNMYLVADSPGGKAVLVDTGGLAEPILKKIEELKVSVTHILCTHHHIDHISHNDLFRKKFGSLVVSHVNEKKWMGQVDVTCEEGEEIATGDLRIRSLHIPGHTAGQLAFVINEAHVFTGDTLFKGSIGGTRAPGHTTFADIKHSIMEKLMSLPKEMPVYPGHTDATTIGTEWKKNPFIRLWRGIDKPKTSKCTAFGQPATLMLEAIDYDGGTKCWVRFDQGNEDDIVPGSQVS